MPPGRKPNLERYAEVVKMVKEGASVADICAKFQLRPKNASMLKHRALAWWNTREQQEPPTAGKDSWIQGKRLDSIEASIVEIQTKLNSIHLELQELASNFSMKTSQLSSGEEEKIKGAHKARGNLPPRSLWSWIAIECIRSIGVSRVAEWTGASLEEVKLWCKSGIPSSKYRERLKELLASVWARELWPDFELNEINNLYLRGRPED